MVLNIRLYIVKNFNIYIDVKTNKTGRVYVFLVACSWYTLCWRLVMCDTGGIVYLIIYLGLYQLHVTKNINTPRFISFNKHVIFNRFNNTLSDTLQPQGGHGDNHRKIK
jgi:hypothetical protein